MDNRHSSYLYRALSNPKAMEKSVRFVCKSLRDQINNGLCVDAIVCRGISGAVIAAPVSLRLKTNLSVVRKTTTDSHCESDCLVEGIIKQKHNYVIVDDLICSGQTVYDIIQAMDNESQCMAYFQGIVLYGGKYSGQRSYMDREDLLEYANENDSYMTKEAFEDFDLL